MWMIMGHDLLPAYLRSGRQPMERMGRWLLVPQPSEPNCWSGTLKPSSCGEKSSPVTAFSRLVYHAPMVHLYERADNSQSLKDNWRPEGTDLPGEPVPSLFRQT